MDRGPPRQTEQTELTKIRHQVASDVTQHRQVRTTCSHPPEWPDRPAWAVARGEATTRWPESQMGLSPLEGQPAHSWDPQSHTFTLVEGKPERPVGGLSPASSNLRPLSG